MRIDENMGPVWGNGRYTKGIMSLQILCLVNSSLPIVAAQWAVLTHKGLKMARAQDGGAVGLGRDCRYARSNGGGGVRIRVKPSMVLYGQLSSAVCRAPGNPWRHLQHPQLCFSSWPAQCRRQGCFTKRRCVRNLWNRDWEKKGWFCVNATGFKFLCFARAKEMPTVVL